MLKIIGAGTYFPALKKEPAYAGKPYYVTKPVAEDNDLMTDWAVALSNQVLAKAACKPKDIDLIISVSVTPDHLVGSKDVAAPRLCHPLQRELQAEKAFVFDMIDADWASIIDVADAFVQSQSYSKILIVRTEIFGPSTIPDQQSGFSFPDGAGVLLLEADRQSVCETNYVYIESSFEPANIHMLDPQFLVNGKEKTRIHFEYNEGRVAELNKVCEEILLPFKRDPRNHFQILAESWLPGHNTEYGIYKNYLKNEFNHLGPFTLPFYASEILSGLRRIKSEEPLYKILNLSFNPFVYRYGYNFLYI